MPSVSHRFLFVFICFFLGINTGCLDDPYDPQTWIEKLDDPSESAEALKRLAQLRDPIAIAPLGDFWKKRNYSSRVLRTIIGLAEHRDDEKNTGPSWTPAIPYLIKAVEHVDIADQSSRDDAVAALHGLAQAADAGIHQPAIEDILKTTATMRIPKLSPGQRIRLTAITALGKYGHSENAVNTLIKILETDPIDKQPLPLFAATANALAEAAAPTADRPANEQAITPLLITMYRIPAIYQQCRKAITALGKAAIPSLLSILQGKHKKINRFAKDNNYANHCNKKQGKGTTCTAPGNLIFKAAQLLGDMRVKKALSPLLRELENKPKVAFYNPQTGRPGPVTHSAILDALRTIGNTQTARLVYNYSNKKTTPASLRPLAIDVYSMLVKNKRALPKLAKFILNDREQEQMRLASGLAYGRLANTKAQLKPIATMIRRYKTPADKLEKQAKATKNPQKKRQLMNQSRGYRRYQNIFEEHQARINVGIKCRNKKASCYTDYLEVEDVATSQKGLARVERALLDLAKLGPKAKSEIPKLLEHVKSSERIVRQGILLALTRMTGTTPCPSCETVLADVIETQKDQTTIDYLTADTKIVLNYLKTLRN